MSKLDDRDYAQIGEWLAARRPGYGLTTPFYREESIYAAEIEAIWRRSWLLAGHSCQIPEPGDYFVYEMDRDSLIVIRGDDGVARALSNTCRHRGTVVCEKAAGHAGRLVCPYHQWTYARDGRLMSSRGMQDEIERDKLGLVPAAAAEVAGLLFVCLADDPPDFELARAEFETMIQPQGLAEAQIAQTIDYVVEANWKVVWENNRECYHCNANHPQYVRANFDHYNANDTSEAVRQAMTAAIQRSEAKWGASVHSVTHRKSGMTVFPDPAGRVWYSVNRTPMAEGYVSETMDGKQVAPLMGDYVEADVGTLRVRAVPSMWNHSSCDHAVTTRLVPLDVQRTHVQVTWLIAPGAVAGEDYQLDAVTDFWRLTSEQDWRLCRAAQRGMTSRAYQPGPLSTYKEYNVEGFLNWYVQRLSAWLEGSRADCGPR